jgi:hypothetical protein
MVLSDTSGISTVDSWRILHRHDDEGGVGIFTGVHEDDYHLDGRASWDL